MKAGVDPRADMEKRLRLFLDWLIRWNARVPLVSRRLSREQIQRELLSPLVEAARAAGPLTGRLADLGAGSGMGGVVFALANPALDVTFVERVRKKAVFIRQITHALGLGERATVVDRDLRHSRLPPNTFKYALVRAVGGADDLLQLFRPSLVDGGCVFLLLTEAESSPRGWRLARAVPLGAGMQLRVLV